MAVLNRLTAIVVLAVAALQGVEAAPANVARYPLQCK